MQAGTRRHGSTGILLRTGIETNIMRAGLRRKGLGSAKLALAGSGAGFLRVQGCAHLAGALRVSRDTSALPRAFPVVPLDHISQRNQVERMQHLPPPLALALRISQT